MVSFLVVFLIAVSAASISYGLQQRAARKFFEGNYTLYQMRAKDAERLLVDSHRDHQKKVHQVIREKDRAVFEHRRLKEKLHILMRRLESMGDLERRTVSISCALADFMETYWGIDENGDVPHDGMLRVERRRDGISRTLRLHSSEGEENHRSTGSPSSVGEECCEREFS